MVKCDKVACTKEYEIERDELILALEPSLKINQLAKQNKLKQLGMYMTDQLFDNTHSFTNNFTEFNRL